MTTQTGGVLIVHDDGVTVLPDAIPVVHGMVEAVELLFASLGIPARDERGELGDSIHET